jgi:hypothetical protein
MVGLVLAVQNATDLYATWAYAWALVAPGGVGVGLVAYGFLSGQREVLRAGLPILGVGVALFLGFGLFFEGVSGSGRTAIGGAESSPSASSSWASSSWAVVWPPPGG